jgi:hypothetical protein
MLPDKARRGHTATTGVKEAQPRSALTCLHDERTMRATAGGSAWRDVAAVVSNSLVELIVRRPQAPSRCSPQRARDGAGVRATLGAVTEPADSMRPAMAWWRIKSVWSQKHRPHAAVPERNGRCRPPCDPWRAVREVWRKLPPHGASADAVACHWPRAARRRQKARR